LLGSRQPACAFDLALISPKSTGVNFYATPLEYRTGLYVTTVTISTPTV